MDLIVLLLTLTLQNNTTAIATPQELVPPAATCILLAPTPVLPDLMPGEPVDETGPGVEPPPPDVCIFPAPPWERLDP